LPSLAAAAPESTRTVSVVTIRNSTPSTVHYELQWPGGKWESFDVQPNTDRYHWHNGSELAAHIRFDHSFEPGYQERGYKLVTLDFIVGGNGGRNPQARDGTLYQFKLNADHNGLDLFGVRTLNRANHSSARPALNGLRDFPRLLTNFEVLATPAPKSYNCIAWSLGITDKWVWPGTTIADFDKLNAKHGYRRLATVDLSLKAGQQKIALYATRKSDGTVVCTHQALQAADGTWTSKLGELPLIKHMTADAVGGGSYGEVVAVYVRAASGSTHAFAGTADVSGLQAAAVASPPEERIAA
jgi:hypothetical protein